MPITIPETGDEREQRILEKYAEDLQMACAKALAGYLTKKQLQDELVRLADANDLTMYTLYGASATNARGKKYLAKEHKLNVRSARKMARDVFSGRYSVE